MDLNLLQRGIDRTLQICGAFGVPEDALLSHGYGEAQPLRIYEDPSEAHWGSIARRIFRKAAQA